MTGDGAPLLGVDIGGTKLAVAVSTSNGEVLAAQREPSRAEEGPDAMIARAADMARAVVAEAGLGMPDIEGIGIGCGGPLDPWRGVILNALNNPGWTNVPLVERIQAELGRPTFLDNDANAAALGEHRFGAGRGVRNMVYLTISTGVGGGLILDDRLFHGENGNAGELGHISVRVAGGRPCHCGSSGCIETYCSGTNIAARAREALERDEGATSVLADHVRDEIRAEHVVAAARDGDPMACAIWNETTELLGGGIVSIIHAFNPQLVVLGGGVTHAGEMLFDPLRRVIAGRAMPWLSEAVTIVPAELGEHTGVLGAVAVALERMRMIERTDG
jgi:glucokinase